MDPKNPSVSVIKAFARQYVAKNTGVPVASVNEKLVHNALHRSMHGRYPLAGILAGDNLYKGWFQSFVVNAPTSKAAELWKADQARFEQEVTDLVEEQRNARLDSEFDNRQEEDEEILIPVAYDHFPQDVFHFRNHFESAPNQSVYSAPLLVSNGCISATDSDEEEDGYDQGESDDSSGVSKSVLNLYGI